MSAHHAHHSNLVQPLLFGGPAASSAPATIELRHYQERSIADVYALRAPGERVLLVAPTGAGKTVIGSRMILDELAAGGRVIFIAHRTELISQTYGKLLAMGLDERLVGVIMADGVIAHPVTGRRVCCARPLAPVQVASIDTLRRRPLPPGITLVIVDECFPAGTLVDGRPIESFAVGDTVRSFNHATGRVELRPVTHLFRSVPQAPLVTVRLADGTRITCTGGHPFYTRGGYVPAAALTPGVEVLRVEDCSEGLRGVRDDVYAPVVEQPHDPDLLARVQGEAGRVPAARRDHLVPSVLRDDGLQGREPLARDHGSPVLLAGVQPRGARGSVCRDDGRDESSVRERAHEGAQPDAARERACAGLDDAAQDRVDAAGAMREGAPDARSAAAPGERTAGLGDRVRGADGAPEGPWERGALHARHRGPEGDGRGQSGRREPLRDRGAGAGREEGCVPSWSRVDGVEVHERGGAGGPDGVCPDGHVYNLEVDGNHNYFVEGVLVHNCHRSLAKSYRDVVDGCPEALTVGLTATPYRGDGRGLGDIFRKLVVVTTPRQLMGEGFLAEPRVFSHPHRADVSKVTTVAGEYNEKELAAACDKRELLGSIVEHWRKHLDGVRTVAFAVNVAHSQHIAAMFVEAGIPAEHLDGETKPDLRAAILARLDSGETLVVTNCGVLCEGWDQPSVKGCILARPTKSRALYVQCAGRVLRPWRGMMPYILDHAGSVLEHDLPHADWEITLEGRKKKAKTAVSVKECPTCFGCVPSNAKVCIYCGHPFVAAVSDEGEPLRERDGQLVEIRADELRALKLQTQGPRGELQSWAERVDREHRLDPGTTNRRCMRVFRKSRSEMTGDELAAVRAWMLVEEPWLDAAPVAPMRFDPPAIAEVAAW